MLQTVSLDIVLNHYGPKAVQMLQIASLRIILELRVPKEVHILQMVSFGIILDHFGPRLPRHSKWPASHHPSVHASPGHHFYGMYSPYEIAFHSK